MDLNSRRRRGHRGQFVGNPSTGSTTEAPREPPDPPRSAALRLRLLLLLRRDAGRRFGRVRGRSCGAGSPPGVGESEPASGESEPELPAGARATPIVSRGPLGEGVPPPDASHPVQRPLCDHQQRDPAYNQAHPGDLHEEGAEMAVLAQPEVLVKSAFDAPQDHSRAQHDTARRSRRSTSRKGGQRSTPRRGGRDPTRARPSRYEPRRVEPDGVR